MKPTDYAELVQGGPDFPRTASTSRRGDFEVRSLARSIAKRSGTTTINPPLLLEPLEGPVVACTGSPITTGPLDVSSTLCWPARCPSRRQTSFLRLDRLWLITCLPMGGRDQRGHKGGKPLGTEIPMVVSQLSWRCSARWPESGRKEEWGWLGPKPCLEPNWLSESLGRGNLELAWVNPRPERKGREEHQERRRQAREETHRPSPLAQANHPRQKKRWSHENSGESLPTGKRKIFRISRGIQKQTAGEQANPLGRA